MLFFCGENCSSAIAHILFGPTLIIFVGAIGLLSFIIVGPILEAVGEDAKTEVVLLYVIFMSMTPVLFVKTLSYF
jgi:hypothetical protein